GHRTSPAASPLIVDALSRLRSRSCIIDGEAVACDDNGVASFDLVRHHRHNDGAFLYAFDLIELNGDDLRRDPLEVRSVAPTRRGHATRHAIGGARRCRPTQCSYKEPGAFPSCSSSGNNSALDFPSRGRSRRVCKAWARVPAGIANARARSLAAPIANREPQKSTGGGRKCSQLFSVEHEGERGGSGMSSMGPSIGIFMAAVAVARVY